MQHARFHFHNHGFPIHPHLGTNYCPTDDEVGEIKAFLIEPALRLKQLDDDISDL
jgi:hypothetical protein